MRPGRAALLLPLLLFLACAALAEPGSAGPKPRQPRVRPGDSDDRKLRHDRSQSLDDLFRKASRTEETPPEEEDADEDDLPEYSDYEYEEPKQHGAKDLIDRYVHDLSFNDDPSMEDYDSDWETGLQADSTTSNWSYWGTRHDIQRGSKKNTKIRQSGSDEANRHITKMMTEGFCKTPQQRIVDIQTVYPNPSKIYIPHCTILHRCGDDTGCCRNNLMTCVPKTQVNVDLYFYINIVGHSENIVEKLRFTNHTECMCVSKRTDYMIKDETVPISSLRPGPNYHRILDIPEAETDAPVPLKRCQCPTEFSVHILEDGECDCDCSNKQRACIRIKKGREHFGLKDRICIQNGQCQIPSCEFGNYNQKAGRCPKKQERVDDILKHSRISRSK